MSWYVKAEAWHQFGPTITLYHGTNERNMESIRQAHAIVPPDPDKIIDRVLRQYGFTRGDVPNYIWRNELVYREGKRSIFCSTSKDTASRYAQSHKYGGEIENSVTNLLVAWATMEKVKQIEPEPSRGIVLTIEIPWEKTQHWRSMDELREVYKNMEALSQKPNFKLYNPPGWTLKDELDSIDFEVRVTEPIPMELITKWEFV